MSTKAVASIIEFEPSEQILLLNLADNLARNPFRIGDYSIEDAHGRKIEHILLQGFIIDYWVDHAVKEVRINEITRV